MNQKNREISFITGIPSAGNYKPAGAQNQQFPGLNLAPGITIDQIRDFIKKQKKIKGFQVSMPATNTWQYPVQLSGDARLLLGFIVFSSQTDPLDPTNYPDQLTLEVNQEIVVQEVHGYGVSPAAMTDEYYFIPRPLSGQDVITLKGNNPNAAKALSVLFYYI